MDQRRGQVGATETPHYESPRRRREKQRGPAVMQPPLTPMIDVVFQLLLFFLLACQFRETEGQIRANLPDISGLPPRVQLPLEPLRVTLLPRGPRNESVVYKVEGRNQEFAGAGELYAFLVQVKQRLTQDGLPGEARPVLIQPRGTVRWGYVVDAFNQAVRAAYKKVGLSPSGS